VSAPALGAVDGLDNPPYNGLYYLQGSSGPPSPSIQSIIGAPVQPVQPVPRYLPVSAEGKKPMIRDWPNEASSELGDVRRWLKPGHRLGLVPDHWVALDFDGGHGALWARGGVRRASGDMAAGHPARRASQALQASVV
jgi:Bifunctional DNA primase/polymerase, N-terminal